MPLSYGIFCTGPTRCLGLRMAPMISKRIDNPTTARIVRKTGMAVTIAFMNYFLGLGLYITRFGERHNSPLRQMSECRPRVVFELAKSYSRVFCNPWQRYQRRMYEV